MAQLKDELKQNFRGHLVVCPDSVTAESLLSALDEDIDTEIGCSPSDRRGFNALCVAPKGDIPSCYKNVYYAGIPAALCTGGTRISDLPQSDLFHHMPDKDGLRALFKALRSLSQSGQTFGSAGEACLALSELCQMQNEQTAPGVCVLMHAGLCAFEKTDKGYRPKVFLEKRDPLEDSLYRALNRREEI